MARHATTDGLASRPQVLLTFQVALLGMIPPSLRAVTVGWRADRIDALLVFDGPLESRDQELCWELEAEVAASFPELDVSVGSVRLDAPLSFAQHLLDAWVYARLERDDLR